MNWSQFLTNLCQAKNLTPAESAVLMCLQEDRCLNRKELQDTYNESHQDQKKVLQEEALSQRLKSIYSKFGINNSGPRLPVLYTLIKQEYQNLTSNTPFHGTGLTNIYPCFPEDRFRQEINNVINSENLKTKEVNILQTFAPNLAEYRNDLIQCINSDVLVRVLLAWPHSRAAQLRQEVLRQYGNNAVAHDLSNLEICNEVIRNLETLQAIVEQAKSTNSLQIRLYDTVPSVAMYRAGNYLLAGLFLHGQLAIKTFQLELSLDSPNSFVADTLLQDFELMWEVARSFSPEPGLNWRSDLSVLFT